MKRLNRKGFTLIELLAVIVIMAIIVVATVPTIINSIADARINSIWNLAVSTANSYDTMAAQDLIATTPSLTGGMAATKNWKCISSDLAELLDLSTTDVVIKEINFYTDEEGSCSSEDNTCSHGAFTSNTRTYEVTLNNNAVDNVNTCSAIRLKDNGTAEVLLVAADGGKFDVSGKYVYGLSSLDNGGTNDIE